MPEYLNGKIYTIRSYKSDLIFFGATTLTRGGTQVNAPPASARAGRRPLVSTGQTRANGPTQSTGNRV